MDLTHKVGATPLLKHVFKNAYTESKKMGLFQNFIARL